LSAETGRLAVKSTPTVGSRLVARPFAAFGGSGASDLSSEVEPVGGFSAAWCCSNSMGWDVAEALVQAVVIEPGDPCDGRELDLGVRAPNAVGDQLGLVGIHERFRERVGDRRQLRSVSVLSSEFV
jgi:hypothetical protein